MSNRQELTRLLVARLQDDASALTAPEVDDALEQALQEYSERRPLRSTWDLTGDGSTTLFALDAAWEQEWSRILAIELPTGHTPRTMLDPSGWHLERHESATPPTIQTQLRFASAPGDGDMARVTFTRLHAATQTLCTVPTIHQRAVATLGAAIALAWIATQKAANTANSLGADAVEQTQQTATYTQRATALRERFDAWVPPHRPARLTVVRA